jgi:NhaA family Na+:H+ antiporter
MTFLRPFEGFLQIEAASGILLLIAAAFALAWANSPWAASYDQLWHTTIAIGIGEWTMAKSLHFWINELLMTFFFLLVGLEIKRGTVGWGVPMATDIAFAVGVLTLLGRRVHPTVRVLLLAFAIIDDIGAILVIALFYSSGFAVDGLMIAGGGLLMAWLFLTLGVRPGAVFTFPLFIMWAGLYRAGIHPTIAGVVLGLLIPVRAWYGSHGFLRAAQDALDDFRARVEAGQSHHELLEPLDAIAEARREAVAPAVRGEAVLHPWVAYGIMPLFALANAGVHLQGLDFQVPSATPVLLGVVAGLVLGKPIGVLLVSWLSVRSGLCALPRGVTWGGMMVMGAAGGIGFTMAIFIAELAFPGPELLAVAKLGVLAATATAGAIALLSGWILPRAIPMDEVEDLTADAVEESALA